MIKICGRLNTPLVRVSRHCRISSLSGHKLKTMDNSDGEKMENSENEHPDSDSELPSCSQAVTAVEKPKIKLAAKFDNPISTSKKKPPMKQAKDGSTDVVMIEGNKQIAEQSNTLEISRSGSSRPNCFVGLVIDNPSVIQSVTAYHRKILEMAEKKNVKDLLKIACVPLKKLHITLCVCTVDNEDLATVKEVTKSVFADAFSFNLHFSGMDRFGRNVFFAIPHGQPLYQYGNRLQKSLTETGINMQGNKQPFKPHLTLVKFRGSSPDPSVFEILNQDYLTKWNFKGQVIGKVVICKIGSRAQNGSYKTFATYNLNDSASSGKIFPVSGKKGRKSQKQKPQRKRSRNCSDKFERDVQIGKALSAVLRHNKYGFKIDSGGYVEVDEILKHQPFYKSLHASREDIYRVVETNDKRRFQIDTDSSGVEMIKATQGHTVVVEDLDLREITDPCEYPTVVHGSFWKFWKPISLQGLHRRKRIHIHMTTAEPSDENSVISGMRKSCNLFIYIDIAAAMADGIQFFVSANGVILSPGDDMGYIAPKYFLRVIGTSKRQRIDLLTKEIASGEHDEHHFDETVENTELENINQTENAATEDTSAAGNNLLPRNGSSADVHAIICKESSVSTTTDNISDQDNQEESTSDVESETENSLTEQSESLDGVIASDCENMLESRRSDVDDEILCENSPSEMETNSEGGDSELCKDCLD